MDWETIKNVVFQRFGRGRDDDKVGTGFPGGGKEFVESGEFDWVVGSEDGDMLAGGMEDFVNKMSDRGFSGGAGDADEFHVANRVAVISRKKFGASPLGLDFQAGFCGFLVGLRVGFF